MNSPFIVLVHPFNANLVTAYLFSILCEQFRGRTDRPNMSSHVHHDDEYVVQTSPTPSVSYLWRSTGR